MNNFFPLSPSYKTQQPLPCSALRQALRLVEGLNRGAVLRLAGRRSEERNNKSSSSASEASPQDPKKELRDLRSLDPAAITRIHNRYFEDVFRFARYRLSDEALAEDIAAETFKRLLEYIHRGRGPKTNVRGWLMRTAANLANDYYRAVYNRPTEDLPDAMPSEQPGPAGMLEISEEKRELQVALQQLTEDQANVLALRFGSGLSLAETAEALGKKVNAIKALQFRAVGALRREIGSSPENR